MERHFASTCNMPSLHPNRVGRIVDWIYYSFLPWLKPEVSWWDASWVSAAGLAASMLALTLFAGKLLNPDRKDDIALWLMGGTTEESWSRSFTSLFDAVFGKKHWSMRCVIRSSIASLIAVVLIWQWIGQGLIGTRLPNDASLGRVLLAALVVNLVADYLSLLETRFLLGQMHRFKTAWQQAVILLVDALLSGLIIWIAIRTYLTSPISGGASGSFPEIAGIFSIYSVLFYSTFLTSVWTWGYVLSTWLMRLFTRLRIAHFLDVVGKPMTILGYAMALITFSGAMLMSMPMQRDSAGLTVADHAVCDFFGGDVCLRAAALTTQPEVVIDLYEKGCESGASPSDCIDLSLSLDDPLELETEIRLIAPGCEAGDEQACLVLEFLEEAGAD